MKISTTPKSNRMKNKFTFANLFSASFILLALFSSYQSTSQTVLLNPASPWMVPVGVTQIKVELWGGGGAGGGCSTLGSGGGGGGGAYNTSTISVSAGQNYLIVKGNGGTPTGSNQNGPAGTASTFSTSSGTLLLSAAPGTGGTTGGTAGAAGVGVHNGAAGGTNGGVGGGGAGNLTDGSGRIGGTGSPNVAPYIGGNGGTSVSASNNGVAGSAPGGGGSGAISAFGGSKTGGAGGVGQVIITYCQTFSLTSMTAITPACVTTSNTTVTLNGNLPVGSYTVTYSLSSPALSNLTASMSVSTANTGTFVASGLSNVGNITITVTNIGSSTSTFCTNNVSSNNTTTVNITGAATVNAGADQILCATVPATLNGFIGGTATSATWSGGTGTFTPNNITLNASYLPSAAERTAGSATLTLTTNIPVGACPAVSDAMIISIKAAPTAISITPASSTFCIGGSVALAAAATVSSTSNLSSDNFNGTISYASAGSNSGGGTIFSQQSSGYSVNLNTINNTDGSKYVIATTAAGLGNASTTSTLTSPVINTTAYSSLVYTFRHFYTKGNEAGVSVQVSTNGGTSWSNVSTTGAIIGTNTYTATTGASGAFAAASFNLTPFINQANFRIRFNFVSSVGILGSSWWALDDPALNGIPLPLYSWTANTASGINGLPAGAGNSTIANKNITVTPTATTTYSLTALDPFTNCGISTVTATVNVNQNSTIALSSDAGTNAQTICLTNPITPITYAIGGGGTGASITAGALPAGLTAGYSAGVFTISGTPTGFGNFNYTVTTTGPCVNATLNGTLTVNTAPALICPADVITNTDAGVCMATRSFTATATGFPDPGVSYLINGNFIDFPYDFPPGITTVDVLAEGACAPDATCSFTVTVNDLEGPLADIAALPDLTAECSLTVTDIPTATDACDGPVTGTTTDPLTYNTQGTHIITWTYTDLKGNTSSQTQTVILDDVTAPVADLATLPDATGECSVTVSVSPTATDNCIGAVMGTTTDPLTYSAQGTHIITWTFDDGNGNSSTQTQNVIVDDITAPVPNLATLPDITGECSVTVSEIPAATDNCIGAVNGTTTDPLTYNIQGTYTITWTFDDGNGNSSTQTQQVILDDISAPVPAVANLSAATGECTVTVSAPMATDNCVGTVTGTTTDPLTYNTQGIFTINWTFDDGNGNTSTQTQQVIVDDITAPVPDVVNLPDAIGECAVTITAPTATDNCAGAITATTTDPVTYNAQGTFTVNWTYNDGNGNISGQTQTVVVDDITAPVPDLATLPAATGECSVTVTNAPTATDNCVGSVTGTTTDPLTYNAQGSFTITWNFNDGNGNTSTQTQSVIVNDITAPVINCPAAQAFCSVPGNIFTIPVLTATDNCGVTSITYQVTGATTRSGSGNNASGLFNVGASTISWTVTDGNNNSSSCSTSVNINIPPAIPAAINGPTNVCPYIGTGEQITYSVAAVPFAQGYQWTVPSTVNIVSTSPDQASITVTITPGFISNINKVIKVRSLSACGNSADRVLYLLAQFPSTPGFITGPTDICALIGTTTEATYVINKVTAATSYLWGTQAGTTSVTHPNGPGINDTIIKVIYAGGYTTSSITVQAVNDCGTSGSARSLAVPRNIPSTPGLISGPTDACAYSLPGGTTAFYSIHKMPGVTSYNWITPANWTVTHQNASGANDTAIIVQYPNGFSSGSMSVTATNGCGTSATARSLSITRLNPATPSVIDVIQLSSCPNRTYSYTLSAMPANATSIEWTVPASAIGGYTVLSPYSISVTYPSTAVQGTITAVAKNNCASSVSRVSPVKLPACPSGFAGKQQTVPATIPQADMANIALEVFPNPTVSDFNLRVSTGLKEKISVRILDVQGRELQTLTISANELVSVGNKLKAGTYVIEVRQGKEIRTTRVMKF